MQNTQISDNKSVFGFLLGIITPSSIVNKFEEYNPDIISLDLFHCSTVTVKIVFRILE